jgi:hypothetical protein
MTKQQIKRWMAYQYMKDNDLDPKDSGAQNPYRILLHQLTGAHLQRPRLKTAANVWRRTHKEEIEEEVKKQANACGWNRKKLAPLREKIAKEKFGALSPDVRLDWERMAKDEHEEAVELYNKEINSPPSTEPADRQRCVTNFSSLIFSV